MRRMIVLKISAAATAEFLRRRRRRWKRDLLV
jgi:hypothetical protein